MSYIEIDDGILDHPKFIRAAKLGGSEAIHLWLGMRAYVAKLLTDGFVPDDMLDEVRGPKDLRKRAVALQALRDVGLLDPATGGVQLHNYLERNKSREQVLALRAAARARQTKFRGGNGGSDGGGNAAPNASRHGERNGVTHASPTPSVTVPSPHLSTPLPVPSVPSERGASAPAAKRPQRTRRFPDFEPTPEHVNLALQIGADLPTELAKFRDHEFRDPKSDANACFRSWLRRSIELKRSEIRTRLAGGNRAADGLEQQMARVRALEAQEAAEHERKALPQ
jgi:hypothetical protein